MKAADTMSTDAVERKNRNASFHKRKSTVFSKGNQIHEILGAEVYMAIKYHGQWYEYSSNPDLSFPLSRKDIHIDYPPVKATTPQTFVPAHTSRIIKPISDPEPISTGIDSQSTDIPTTIAPNEHLQFQQLNSGELIHHPTHVPYDSRQLAAPLLQAGEARNTQQPIKRGRGRPRGSGRHHQMSHMDKPQGA